MEQLSEKEIKKLIDKKLKESDLLQNPKYMKTRMIVEMKMREMYLIGVNQNRWINPKTELPKHNNKILFIINGEVRLGVFLEEDQWSRKNMFCDGSFFFTEWVKGWMLCPSAVGQNGA